MHVLIILAILGCVYSSPLKNDVAIAPSNEELISLYVLPGESFPTFYDLQFYFNPGNVDNFLGIASIRIIPYMDTEEITLHAMELDINTIQLTKELNSMNDLYLNYTLATDDTHQLKIQATEPLLALQPYLLTISYVGHYASNMFGVYISTYQDGNDTINLVTSQLQPTFARRAFPCYDEPSMKAIFRTTIYAPSNYTVVRSNMPLRNDIMKPELPGWNKHEFQDTLLMSSYLLSYLVSNFESIDNTNNPIYNVPFSVYSRPGTQSNAEFALDFGQRNMIALEEYTEFPYAFPKLDNVAVPDFAAGAMENWGLVVYREEALLVQEGVTTTNTRQFIGRIICHENTHMWFGNEVGPLSWTYTWLNEGFANFFESFATDLVLPQWRMMDQFVLNMQNVFQSDAVLTVNPMTYEVYTPSQILGTFNSVAYQKSGSVIRMMQHFLTPEVFRQGLAIYIQNLSRRAARPSDLYAALQQALNESNHTIPYQLSTVMERWTTQGGFPVLTVRRQSPEANSISIAQERFLTDNTLSSNDRWHIPVNWVLSTNPNFEDTSPADWVPPTSSARATDIPGLVDAEWFILNKQQTGYYRVNYEPENWRALADVLSSSHETIHVLNRAQLLDDAFNLARNGRLDYNIAFELSRYLVNEADYIPWAAANAAFTYLRSVLAGSPVYDLYEMYLRHLTEPLYDSLGFTAGSTDEHVTAYHRNIILNINCLHGNPDCVETAEAMLEAFRNNPNERLNPDIQTTVYCSGLRGGDVDNFNFLWQQYAATQDSSEHAILLSALGCTSNVDRRDFYMNQVITEDSLVREQNRHSILVSVINSSPENAEAALDFIIENFPNIQSNVQGLSGTTNILNALARTLNTQEHAEKIEEFSSRYQTIFTAGELASIAAIRENIAASITWNRDNLAMVDAWLRLNYENSAHALSASIAVLFSVCLALYNWL